MATVANLTIDELSELIGKCIDKKLPEQQQQRRASQENSNTLQNSHHTHNYSPNTNNQPPRYSGGGYYPRYSPRNPAPHYNNNNNNNNTAPHYTNNNSNNSTPASSRFQHYSPNNKHTFQHHHQYQSRRPYHAIQPLKLMITYVESACVFWGQVLTADLLDATRQLQQDLQDMCPGLAPINHVAKAGMYATQWGDQWYRCITCYPVDAEGNTDVLFVDYGNKERKNVSELVGLRSPKLIEVPFFACPFRFPNMSAVANKPIEEVGGYFDTESILKGFVSQTPVPDQHTDIYLMRPSSTEHPSSLTYNDLMLELGFAKKSDESVEVKTPQPGFFMRALQRRIRNLSDLCRDKDQEIGRLSGLSGGMVQQIPGAPSQDIRYPAEPTTPSPTTWSSKSPDSKSPELSGESLPNGDVSSELVLKTKITQTTETVEDSDCIDNVLSIEEQFQAYLLALIDKLKQYNCTSAQVMSSSDCRKVRSMYEQVESFVIAPDIIELKTSADTALDALSNDTAVIPTCQNAKSLEEAVKSRDESLQTVSDATEAYVEAIEEANLQETIDRISGLITSFNGSVTHKSSNKTTVSTEEMLESLDKVQSRQREEVAELHKQCTKQLEQLNQQLISSSNLLNGNAISVPVEEDDDNTEKELEKVSNLNPSDRDNVTLLGATLESTRTLLQRLSTVTSQHAHQIAPIASELQSNLLKRAKTKLEEMNMYIVSCEQYKTKGQAARDTLQNKPNMSALKEIKTQLKAAKRQVKLVQIKEEDSDVEEGGEDDNIRESMLKLHELYQAEKRELTALLDHARTTHPELLIELPQLKRMAKENGLLRGSWELHEFVMPDTAACINNQGFNVYCGFYSEQDVFFVERPLQSLEGDLEEQALKLVKSTMPDCFAAILDKKSLRVFGATTEAPIN